MYQLLIVNGTVIDGSGTPGVRADVAVEGGRIAAVRTDLGGSAAARRIDASGMVVAPGFIDSHCHSELSLLADPSAESKVRQGVTTEILGNCGWSAAPTQGDAAAELKYLSRPIFGHPQIVWDWKDLAGYFGRLTAQGLGVNVASLVGHGNVRASVLGFQDRKPNDGELAAMRGLVREAMDEGALGMSSGLAYPPGTFACFSELVDLVRVSAAAGGIYTTHMRDQVDALVESVRDTLAVGRDAGSRVLISHHKTVGQRNFGQTKETLALLDQANSAGVEAYSDVYPYIAGSSSMVMLLPPWVWVGGLDAVIRRLDDAVARERMAGELEHGLQGWENRVGAVGWDNITISHVGRQQNRHLEGASVAAAAVERGESPLDFLCRLLVEERCQVGNVVTNSCEEDVIRVMQAPTTMIGSDGLDVGERPHPRQYGTFPRVLGRYVRDENVLTLHQAVRKMTGLTADVFGLHGRGYVREGHHADLVVLDPTRVEDVATFTDPRQYPRGVSHVVVEGVVGVDDGSMTGDLSGRIVRRGDR